eukprot:gene38145-50017_t
MQWYARVSAISDVGTSTFSEALVFIPADRPSAPSSLTLKSDTGKSLIATYFQDAVDNGDPITSYALTITGGSRVDVVQIPVSHNVQKVVTSAHTLPFLQGSSFTLSLGSFYGKYSKYIGKTNTTYFAFFSAVHDTSVVNLTRYDGDKESLMNDIIPGEFVQIGGQEFRVCLNQDDLFESRYGTISGTSIPLCTVLDAFKVAKFDAGFANHVMNEIPVYKLDTFVGGAYNPTMGSSFLHIMNYDRSNNADVIQLKQGDWVMVGHPTEGEVFRVRVNDSLSVLLSTATDVAIPASLTIKSLQHSTYEVQVIKFSTSGAALTASDLLSGYRLRFREETTAVTKIGGDYGCLTVGSTSDVVASELMKLLVIDAVEVSRVQDSSSVSYSITFTSPLVRGNVPSIIVLDTGYNGCNPSNVSEEISTVRESVTPVYRLQTTPDLSYNCSAIEMRDALMMLTATTDVEVSRVVEYNGFSWMVTFGRYSNVPEVALMYANEVQLTAAIHPKVEVISLQQYRISNLTMGIQYYVTAAAINSFGMGESVVSSPVSKQPSDQLPGVPRDLQVRIVSKDTFQVDFNPPLSNGGEDISEYKIQWDMSPTFDSGRLGLPYGEVVLLNSQISPLNDRARITLTTSPNLFPGGTFVVSFDGQFTGELDYNISASGMKAALESLPSIGLVSVTRELF